MQLKRRIWLLERERRNWKKEGHFMRWCKGELFFCVAVVFVKLCPFDETGTASVHSIHNRASAQIACGDFETDERMHECFHILSVSLQTGGIVAPGYGKPF